MYSKFAFFLYVITTLTIQGMDKSKKPKLPSRILHFANSKAYKKNKSIRDTHRIFIEQRILETIAQQTCTSSDLIKSFTDIKSFSLTNRNIYTYFQTNGYKNSVRTITSEHPLTDSYITGITCLKTINKKIWHLFNIALDAEKSFIQQDLQDKWYLDITRSYSPVSDYMIYPDKAFLRLTLLHVTTAALDLKKTKALIDAGADCTLHPNPLALITGTDIAHNNIYIQPSKIETRKKLIAMITLLLSQDIDPDSRCNIFSPTLLHRAAINNDKELASLLLQYNADPYKLFFSNLYDNHEEAKKFKKVSEKLPIDTVYLEIDNSKEPWLENAFTLQEGKPQGWLKDMYDAIQKAKKENTIIHQSLK